MATKKIRFMQDGGQYPSYGGYATINLGGNVYTIYGDEDTINYVTSENFIKDLQNKDEITKADELLFASSFGGKIDYNTNTIYLGLRDNPEFPGENLYNFLKENPQLQFVIQNDPNTNKALYKLRSTSPVKNNQHISIDLPYTKFQYEIRDYIDNYQKIPPTTYIDAEGRTHESEEHQPTTFLNDLDYVNNNVFKVSEELYPNQYALKSLITKWAWHSINPEENPDPSINGYTFIEENGRYYIVKGDQRQDITDLAKELAPAIKSKEQKDYNDYITDKRWREGLDPKWLEVAQQYENINPNVSTLAMNMAKKTRELEVIQKDIDDAYAKWQESGREIDRDVYEKLMVEKAKLEGDDVKQWWYEKAPTGGGEVLSGKDKVNNTISGLVSVVLAASGAGALQAGTAIPFVGGLAGGAAGGMLVDTAFEAMTGKPFAEYINSVTKADLPEALVDLFQPGYWLGGYAGHKLINGISGPEKYYIKTYLRNLERTGESIKLDEAPKELQDLIVEKYIEIYNNANPKNPIYARPRTYQVNIAPENAASSPTQIKGGAFIEKNDPIKEEIDVLFDKLTPEEKVQFINHINELSKGNIELSIGKNNKLIIDARKATKQDVISFRNEVRDYRYKPNPSEEPAVKPPEELEPVTAESGTAEREVIVVPPMEETHGDYLRKGLFTTEDFLAAYRNDPTKTSAEDKEVVDLFLKNREELRNKIYTPELNESQKALAAKLLESEIVTQQITPEEAAALETAKKYFKDGKTVPTEDLDKFYDLQERFEQYTRDNVTLVDPEGNPISLEGLTGERVKTNRAYTDYLERKSENGQPTETTGEPIEGEAGTTGERPSTEEGTTESPTSSESTSSNINHDINITGGRKIKKGNITIVDKDDKRINIKVKKGQITVTKQGETPVTYEGDAYDVVKIKGNPDKYVLYDNSEKGSIVDGDYINPKDFKRGSLFWKRQQLRYNNFQKGVRKIMTRYEKSRFDTREEAEAALNDLLAAIPEIFAKNFIGKNQTKFADIAQTFQETMKDAIDIKEIISKDKSGNTSKKYYLSVDKTDHPLDGHWKYAIANWLLKNSYWVAPSTAIAAFEIGKRIFVGDDKENNEEMTNKEGEVYANNANGLGSLGLKDFVEKQGEKVRELLLDKPINNEDLYQKLLQGQYNNFGEYLNEKSIPLYYGDENGEPKDLVKDKKVDTITSGDQYYIELLDKNQDAGDAINLYEITFKKYEGKVVGVLNKAESVNPATIKSLSGNEPTLLSPKDMTAYEDAVKKVAKLFGIDISAKTNQDTEDTNSITTPVYNFEEEPVSDTKTPASKNNNSDTPRQQNSGKVDEPPTPKPNPPSEPKKPIKQEDTDPTIDLED